MAAKRLKRWVPQVDPGSQSHIDAFLLAKMHSQRVTLQAVLAILKEQECSTESEFTSHRA